MRRKRGGEVRCNFCPDCGSSLYWESDRNPQTCGVASGAVPVGSLPPPKSSAFEEDTHPWLGPPSVTEHHQQGRPIVKR